MPDPGEIVEPQQSYLGFLCEKCGQNFTIIGPLDPVEHPVDQPMRIGAHDPLTATCSHCGHKADYTVAQLIRFPK